MIGRLRGTLAVREADRVLVETPGGVGYEVFVPARTLVELPEPGATVVLEVHTQVREDAITLYGFLAPGDRRAFRLVQSVSGVGPKLALALVGTWTPEQIATAVAAENIPALTKVPGLGTKTAQRLCLELKDKLGALLTAGLPDLPAAPGSIDAALSPAVAETTQALAALGYKKREIDRALKNAAPTPEDGVQSLLRRALRSLSPA